MRFSVCLTLLSPLTLLAFACGSSTGGGTDDPRCTQLCAIEQPVIPNVGEVCSQASADACVQQCAAHIAGTTAPCADCLLQDAFFGEETGGSSGNCMSPSTKCPTSAECTESGNGGTCTYCQDDQAAQDMCYAQAHPLQEVDCPTNFPDATKCTALCAGK